jgi:16S rRNA (cytosine967-C5)-methyltransferase
MAAPGPRVVAARVLRRVEEGAYAPLALDGEAQRARLSPQDRRLATTLVYGVLKGRARLDHALAAYAPRGLGRLDGATLDLLRLGALQLLELRVPAHAAVDETVRQVRALRGARLAGFANALLRKLAQRGAPPPPSGPPARRLSVLSGAPEPVVQAALARLGEAETEALLGAEGAPAPLWLRVNPRRATPEAAAAELAAALPEAAIERSPLISGALRLRGGDGVFDTPAYVEGRVTAQDLGAQLVGALLDPQPGESVLDACAGLGGKTTQLAERMDDRGQLDAVDRAARKLELGQDHARRLGLTIVRSIEADLTAADAPLRAAYDRVLLDAPCSGLGVARRHPEVRLRRGAAEVGELAALQARLLDAVARRVRPGGVLVYAVCTYTDEEGPAQIERFLARTSGFVRDPAAPLPPALGGRGAAGELRTWPHRDDADAFYAARMRRA